MPMKPRGVKGWTVWTSRSFVSMPPMPRGVKGATVGTSRPFMSMSPRGVKGRTVGTSSRSSMGAGSRVGDRGQDLGDAEESVGVFKGGKGDDGEFRGGKGDGEFVGGSILRGVA
eukprot:8608643-Alexandrium_andersonii.AAC.1